MNDNTRRTRKKTGKRRAFKKLGAALIALVLLFAGRGKPIFKRAKASCTRDTAGMMVTHMGSMTLKSFLAMPK